MNRPNNDELIHDFVRETRDELPERVYAAVRREIDQSPQRIVVGPWRTPFMNNAPRYAIAGGALAAVALVAVLAFVVFGKQAPSIGGTGSPTPVASDAPTPTPTPNVTILQASDKGAQLAAGTYAITIPSRVTYTFTLPDGWWLDDIGSGRVQLSRKASTSTPSNTLFLSGVKAVYADPCHTADGATTVDQTVPAIVAALTHLAGFHASVPVPSQLDGATGSTFTLDNTIVTVQQRCSNEDALPQWRDLSDFDFYVPPTAHQRLWVLDIGGGDPIAAQVNTAPGGGAGPDAIGAEDIVNTMTFTQAP